VLFSHCTCFKTVNYLYNETLTQTVSDIPVQLYLRNSSHFLGKCKTKLSRQVAQLLQRDCAAGWVSFGQKWETETGRQYFADNLLSTTVT